MNKNKRLEFRTTETINNLAKQQAAAQGISLTEHFEKLITEYQASGTHESYVKSCLPLNRIINMIQRNPDLPGNFKSDIEEVLYDGRH